MTQPAPFFETCPPQPYLGIVSTVPMNNLHDASSGFGLIFTWLGMNRIDPTGPTFYRYLEFQQNDLVTIEIGVPTEYQLEADHRFVSGVLPGGKYLSLLHSGDHSGLHASTEFLLNWANSNKLVFQCRQDEDTSIWTARLEWYLVNPTRQPDPSEWQTKISILLA